jgi:hypothetical protein
MIGVTKKEYKEEGLRRMKARKKKRNDKYREWARKLSDYPRSVTISRLKWGMAYWADPNSPTGFSQNCDYIGTCQHPCNGDC